MTSREPDWDSSFNQILNRTKQNLNRINQRYAPGPELTSSYNLPIVPAVSNNENRYSRGNVYESSNQSTMMNSQSAMKNNNKAPSNSDQDSLIYALIERVSKLELSEQANASTSQRLTAIEKTLGDINSSISASFHDMKEMQRNILALQNKSAVTSGIIEVIQHDNDSKRSVISKMDSWIRQGEIWREDIDEKMNTLRKLTAQQDRQRQEQRDQMNDSASKFDLEQMRDKVSIQTQQTISAQLSAWYEKVEYNLRNLEKQVALVRINASPKEGMLVTPEEVHAALNTSMPSEMLVKGAVSTQILDLEGKLEEKLEARLSSFLKNEAIKSHNDLQKVIRDKINLLCAENGIVGATGLNTEDPYGEEGGISDTQLLEEAQVSERYRKRIVNAKLEAEKELFSLSTQISDLRGTLASLQNTINVDQNTSKAALLNMERKVEEAIVISNNSVQSINSRYSKIEDRQRESEVKQSDSIKATKEELIAKINDLSKDWLLERVTLDRRLLINENIAADCLERIKLSTTVLDTYFANSKDIITFRQTTEDFNKLQIAFNNLVNDVRDTSNTVFKLSANNVTKSDYVSLMERLTAMEPVVHDTIPEYVESTKKLVDYQLAMQSKVSNIENINTFNNNELQNVITRLNSLTTTATTANSLATVASEEMKLITGRLNQLDSSYHNDVTSLKDLTGAMSSRIMAVESKLTLASKTAQSENVIKNNQLLSMSTQISAIQSSHNDLQSTLNKIQNVAETHRNEVNTKLSLMDIRIHQAQHSGGVYAAPPAAASAAPSSSPNTSFASQSASRSVNSAVPSATAAPAPVVTASTTAGYVVEMNKRNNAAVSTAFVSEGVAAPSTAAVNVSSSFAESDVVHNSFDDVTNVSFAAPISAVTTHQVSHGITATSSGAFLTDYSVSMNDRTATEVDDDDGRRRDDEQDHHDQGVNDFDDSYMSTTNVEPLPHQEEEEVSASLVQESYLDATRDAPNDVEQHDEEDHSIEDPDDYNSASSEAEVEGEEDDQADEESQHDDHDNDSHSGSEHDDEDDQDDDDQLSVHDGEPSPKANANQSVSLEALAAMANTQQAQPSIARQSQLNHSVLENSFDESSSMVDIPDLDKSTTDAGAISAPAMLARGNAVTGSKIDQRSSLEDSFASSDLEELPRANTAAAKPATTGPATSTATAGGKKTTGNDSDSDNSISKIDQKVNKNVGEISMIPMSNNNSFDDSTMQLDNSLLHGLSSKPSAASVTTAASAAVGGSGGNKNSSMMLNSFDESIVHSTPAKGTTAVPPLDLKPASQKLHNDWDDSDAELSPHKPTATKPGASARQEGNNNNDASDSSFATCVSPTTHVSNAVASSYVPVTAPSVVEAPKIEPVVVKASAPTPVSVSSSQPPSQAPTPPPGEGGMGAVASAVTATLSIKERLKLRQEMLKQQKLDSASSIDRASPVPTAVPTPAAAAPAAPAAAPVPVTVSAPIGIAAAATASISAPTPAASSAAPSSASTNSPRRPPIPTLNLPAKGDPAPSASVTTDSAPAPTINRRKSIDDILSAKTSQLDFSFDSDSEEEPAKGGSTTGKYTAAPAVSATTTTQSSTASKGYSGSTASKAASKNYDDDVQEFDADEFD